MGKGEDGKRGGNVVIEEEEGREIGHSTTNNSKEKQEHETFVGGERLAGASLS